jgi:hypothetical protein
MQSNHLVPHAHKTRQQEQKGRSTGTIISTAKWLELIYQQKQLITSYYAERKKKRSNLALRQRNLAYRAEG